MNPPYDVVFDIAQQDAPWWVLAPGVLILGLAVLLWRSRRTLVGRGPAIVGFFGSRLILTLVIFGAIGWIFVAGWGTLADYNTTWRMLADGRAQVVEGPVANFTPQPTGDHGVESFTVANVPFTYGAASLEPGFRTASTHGGPINKDGINVRIHYCADPQAGRNVILRLEIRK